MNQDDIQHLALKLLEYELNLGRAVRENVRLAGELAKLQPPKPEGGSDVPAIPPKEA